MSSTNPGVPLPPVGVVVDEKAGKDDASSTSTTQKHAPASPTQSPPQSPPISPPVDGRAQPVTDNYSSARPRFDRLGNPIPDRRRPGAMSSVYGAGKIKLPGDLGAKDPRRPRSPAPLPGDLGPNDPRRPRSAHSAHRREISDSADGSEGGRLEEDPPEPDKERHDSDDDADADNDNDTDGESKRGRGRKRPEPGRTTSGKSINLREDSVDSEADFGGGVKPDPTKGQSKLSFQAQAAAPSEKKRVHPSTAFDYMPPSVFSPVGSDDESHSELRAAQKLSLTMSAIHSTPSAHRVIRQIIRGDYAHFQREAEEGRKRQRMYLVATDLSPESEYALEWTIGTVLRDGDTLFAVYAVDEETGVDIGHGADSVRDTAAIIKAVRAAAAQDAPAGARRGRDLPLQVAAAHDHRGHRLPVADARHHRLARALRRQGRPARLLLQLPRHQVLRPRHGRPQEAAQARPARQAQPRRHPARLLRQRPLRPLQQRHRGPQAQGQLGQGRDRLRWRTPGGLGRRFFAQRGSRRAWDGVGVGQGRTMVKKRGHGGSRQLGCSDRLQLQRAGSHRGTGLGKKKIEEEIRTGEEPYQARRRRDGREEGRAGLGENSLLPSVFGRSRRRSALGASEATSGATGVGISPFSLPAAPPRAHDMRATTPFAETRRHNVASGRQDIGSKGMAPALTLAWLIAQTLFTGIRRRSSDVAHRQGRP
nr:uncharacterized protein CFP56_00599 [Quercus suber]